MMQGLRRQGRGHTGREAALEPVPNPRSRAGEKPFRTRKGLSRVLIQSSAGSRSPAKMPRPPRTVAIHSPRAAAVPSRLHALQMAAAMRDATPTGDTHKTADTMRPTTTLKTCNDTYCHQSTLKRWLSIQARMRQPRNSKQDSLSLMSRRWGHCKRRCSQLIQGDHLIVSRSTMDGQWQQFHRGDCHAQLWTSGSVLKPRTSMPSFGAAWQDAKLCM